MRAIIRWQCRTKERVDKDARLGYEYCSSHNEPSHFVAFSGRDALCEKDTEEI